MAVIVGSGIYGTVKSVDLAKGTVDVKIAKDTVITVAKSAVFKDMVNTPTQK
jgi:preprotein translocase subunit YajC